MTDKLTGVERIAAERRRQIEVEGWSPDRDSRHQSGELARAAAPYAIQAAGRTGRFEVGNQWWTTLWPWNAGWWRPTPNDPIRELEKAGALIAAEIDRLLATKQFPEVQG